MHSASDIRHPQHAADSGWIWKLRPLPGLGQKEITPASSGVNQQSLIDFGEQQWFMVPDGLSTASGQVTAEQLKQWHEEGACFKAVTPTSDLMLTSEI